MDFSCPLTLKIQHEKSLFKTFKHARVCVYVCTHARAHIYHTALLYSIFFLATPVAWGCSRARDPTHATALIATTVATLHPYSTELLGKSDFILGILEVEEK